MTLLRSETIQAATERQRSTVGELLAAQAAAHPSRPALVDGLPAGGRRWTYAELYAEAERVARFLLTKCEPGDRIAICGPNIPEWVVTEFAAALAGLVIVGINPAMTAAEIGYAIRQSGTRLVATVREYRGSDRLTVFQAQSREAPGLQTVLRLEDALAWPGPGEPEEGPLPPVAPNDPFLIQYTSGTTGAPKGAILTHDGVTVNMRQTVQRFALADGATWLGVVPMHHLTGSVANTIGALTSGGTHVIATWAPGEVIRLIERERVGVLQAVPTMLLAMMEHPDLYKADLSSLDLIVSGGTVVLPEVVARSEKRFGCDFTVVFGQTEAGAYITTTHRTDSVADRTERVGTPLDCFDVRVCDSAGQILGCGQIGEIWLRGPSVMRGYHNMPEETAATLDPDGWMHTGDLGFMDDRRYLQVTGKLKDLIIRKGVNIYPREIENRLAAHPDVADAVVVGVPDVRTGEQVAAFVRMLPGRRLDDKALAEFASETLSSHKVPTVWVPMDQFPVTASGKVQKFRLRDDYQAGRYHTAAP
jgi:fatty-acyl-CoA synthase